jgi:hypothetical protein
MADTDNNQLAGKKFGLGIADFSAGLVLGGDIDRYLETLKDIDFEALSNDTDIGSQDIDDLVTLAANLSSIDDPGNALMMDANGGSSIRIGHMAVGARISAAAVARVYELDTTNLGLSFSAANLNTEINDAAAADSSYLASPQATSGYQVLTDQQADDIATALGTVSSDDSISFIDYHLAQNLAEGNIRQEEIDDAVELVINGFNATDGVGGIADDNNLENNTSVVIMKGLATAQIPVSYGRAITDNISVGVTGKYMIGRVYGTAVLVFDDDNDEVLDNIDDSYETSHTFGVDLSVLARYDDFQVGAIARNINSPSFDGFTFQHDVDKNGIIDADESYEISEVELEPQITIGGAWIPFDTLTVSADVDLLEVETVLQGYNNQYIRAGAEWDVLNVLSLRGGAYKNMAEDDAEVVLTAGVGFNLYLMRIDLAAAATPFDTVEFDGNDIPTEARFSLGIAMDF